MPFIVTTKREGTPHSAFLDASGAYYEFVSRVAVATLEEARERAADTVSSSDERQGGYGSLNLHKAKQMTPLGGTVGPLPDGTLIEVEPVEWWVIHRPIQATRPQASDEQALALFNAREVADAA